MPAGFVRSLVPHILSDCGVKAPRWENLELSGNRVLVHVNVVLVQGRQDEFVTLGLHPCGHKGGKVEAGIAIQHELITDDLVCNIFWCFSLWQTIPVHRDGQPIQPTRSTTLSCRWKCEDKHSVMTHIKRMPTGEKQSDVWQLFLEWRSKAQTLKDAIPLSWLVLSAQRWWDFSTRLERTMFSSTQLTRQQRLHDKGV